MKVVNVCTYRNVPDSERARGYPATHAALAENGIPLCRQNIAWLFINDSTGESTNCKKCLNILTKLQDSPKRRYT